MTRAGGTLTLVLPGLARPTPLAAYHGELPCDAPVLARWLARAQRRTLPEQGTEATLCALFGLDTRRELPLAALARRAESGDASGFWLHADLVHLRPDRHRLLLFDRAALAVTPDELIALAATLADYFQSWGWVLHTDTAGPWYLAGDEAPELASTPLSQVVEQNIDPHLPRGARGRWWRARLNEVQMLLHTHPVNHAREQRGQAAINSLWFWGAGPLPRALSAPWPQIYTDAPYVRGLAHCAGATPAPAPPHAAAWRAAGMGNALLMWHTPGTGDALEAWRAELAAIEQAWIAPLDRWLAAGTLRAVALYTTAGVTYTLTRVARLRVWRRAHGLAALLAS